MIWPKQLIRIIVAGIHEYKETNRIHSVQSSLKSHSVWVTLITIITYTLRQIICTLNFIERQNRITCPLVAKHPPPPVAKHPPPLVAKHHLTSLFTIP